ncbi:hypothetical protein HMPREF0367_00668 [[Eubacterium] cylindroides ATCC 27803]|uniref:Uncharacterized protein n=1 Tax=Faecalitalea cylindroides ATCC 27803 TaxID=649755 RepID=U2R6J3_9FIRM|nr:hypothetical protein HMPREF0367_00668 [[Eubacterium] cylindroides ATCC 27803] [Faecalitalea cylindroides ATCC 27803]
MHNLFSSIFFLTFLHPSLNSFFFLFFINHFSLNLRLKLEKILEQFKLLYSVYSAGLVVMGWSMDD